MNSTGIIRRIDDLGRVVIPREIRQTMNFHDGDGFEIFVDKNSQSITFKKYVPDDNYSQTIDTLHNLCNDFNDVLSATEKNTIDKIIRKLECAMR